MRPGLRLFRFHLLRPRGRGFAEIEEDGSPVLTKIYKGGYFHGYGTRKQGPSRRCSCRTASAARSASSALTSANISTTRMPPSCAASFPSAQDPAPQHHRHLCHASASADRGDQARPSDRSAALRHRITANEKETRGACLFLPGAELRGEKSALAAARAGRRAAPAIVWAESLVEEGVIYLPWVLYSGGAPPPRAANSKENPRGAFFFWGPLWDLNPDHLLKKAGACRLS